MSARFFITGTGTGVGKTLVTEILCRQARGKNIQVTALKPVITGFEEGPHSDTARLLQACGQPVNAQAIDAISPWRFTPALSPDMAAATPINVTKLIHFCLSDSTSPLLLVEGAGGVMTPLNSKATMRDWMAALGWPAILVAGSYLGTLSHTLSAVEALQARGVKIAAIVLSETPQSPPLEETAQSLRAQLGQAIPALLLPRLAEGSAMWQNAPDLLNALGVAHGV